MLALIASRIASADRDTCTNSLQVEGSDTEPDTVLQLFESFGPGTVGLVACNAELLKCEIRGMWSILSVACSLREAHDHCAQQP